MSAARWPAEDVERLRRMKALGAVLGPRLEALLAAAGDSAGADEHKHGECGCVGCASDCGEHKSGVGYGQNCIVRKGGLRYRTVHGAAPHDVPGRSRAWERVR